MAVEWGLRHSQSHAPLGPMLTRTVVADHFSNVAAPRRAAFSHGSPWGGRHSLTRDTSIMPGYPTE